MLNHHISLHSKVEYQDSVAETIADKPWSEKSKALAVTVYTRFLNIIGGTWNRPKYKASRKLPYIPLEKELDSLISAANKKMAAFLQLLKETGMRAGEGWHLGWIDVDLERNLITLNNPEKGGRSRVYYEEASEGKLKLVYEDDGVGISKAEKEKIFNEGYGKGTGYGLYLIRKICEVYGWTIRETGKRGKGAEFTITIPKTNEKGETLYKLH